MKILTSFQFRTFWIFFITVIVVAPFLPLARIYSGLGGFSFDHGWVHFIAYSIAAGFCMFAWKPKTALLLAAVLFLLEVGLRFLHGLMTGTATDYFGLIVNSLGILAGVLFGLNLLVIRARSKNSIAV